MPHQLEIIQGCYCLKIINEIKESKTESESEIVHKFMKTLKKWGIQKERTKKIRNYFTEFLKSLKMNQHAILEGKREDLKG